MKFKHTFFKFSKKDFSLISVIRQVSVYPTFFVPESLLLELCMCKQKLLDLNRLTAEKNAGKTNSIINFFYEIDYFFIQLLVKHTIRTFIKLLLTFKVNI